MNQGREEENCLSSVSLGLLQHMPVICMKLDLYSQFNTKVMWLTKLSVLQSITENNFFPFRKHTDFIGYFSAAQENLSIHQLKILFMFLLYLYITLVT